MEIKQKQKLTRHAQKVAGGRMRAVCRPFKNFRSIKSIRHWYRHSYFNNFQTKQRCLLQPFSVSILRFCIYFPILCIMPEKDAVIDAASHLEEAERLKEEGNEVRFIIYSLI